MSERAEILLITGVVASGKSTVAQLLAERLERSVHLRGDVFRRMVVCGRAEPTPEMSVEAQKQLTLRYRLATAVAMQYLAAGFHVVYQDVILGHNLLEVLALLKPLSVSVVVLYPSPEAVLERETRRDKTGYSDGWTVEALQAELERTPGVGLWIDSTLLTPLETVEKILERREEARITFPSRFL